MHKHELKTDPEVFQAVIDGLKTYEIRKADRDFKVGDALLLRETSHTGAEIASGEPLMYTGREHSATITHILRGPIYGLADGWAVLSIAALEARTPTPAPATDVDALLAEAEDEAPVAGSFRDLILDLATALRESRAREVAEESARVEAEREFGEMRNNILKAADDIDLWRSRAKRETDLRLKYEEETNRVRAERDAAIARAEKAEVEAKEANSTLDMYAKAWWRELKGPYCNKRHEIDALVLTTRKRISERDAAIARAEKAEALCAEYRKKADYCAVCGQTVADPPCPMAGDEMNPCTWPAKCLTRVMEARTERDALAADLAAARAEMGALGPVEYIRETNEHPRIRTYIQCIKDDIDALAIRVVKEAQ